MNHKVSIIIPVHNSAKFLEETLKSAIGQTWKNKEIIVVDDGSKDFSFELACNFESENFFVLRQENKGASAARNLGLEKASGDYIQFLDSDDLLAGDKIEKQIIRLQQLPGNVIASGSFCNFTHSCDRCMPVKKDAGYTDFENPADWLVEAAFGEAMFPPLVWLVPKGIAERAGSWNQSLGYNDDPEYFARILLNAESIAFIEDSLSFYRRGNRESLGSTIGYKARRSELDSLNLVTRHLLEKENSERTRKASAYNYSKIYYSMYPEYSYLRREIDNKLLELRVDPEYDFGKGLTNKISRILGWRAAKRMRYYYHKILNRNRDCKP